MKRTFPMIVAAAFAACAANEGDGRSPSFDPTDSGPAPIEDASDSTTPVHDAGTAEAATCSAAGWCVTPLPDTDLTLRDVWPLPEYTFAIAESPTLGIKVLEWKDAESEWGYIDDNSQNTGDRGQYVGRMWVSSENEIYYTVSPRTVYRGMRGSASPPKSAWTWTYRELEAPALPVNPPPPGAPDHYLGRPRDPVTAIDHAALGVFGTSSGDVYAWFANTIYRRTNDEDDNPSWVVDYVATGVDVAGEQLFFLDATSTGPGDIWFSGGRGRDAYSPSSCALVVHKSAGGYRRVVDGAITSYPPYCELRSGGAVFIDGAIGWLTNIQAVSANEIVGLKGGRSVARITADGEGRYSAVATPIFNPKPMLSLWSAPNQNVWLGGFNIVLRGEYDEDGGAYEVSTLSLNGGWLELPVYRIRGSSNIDLWAVGARYALHKTNP